MLSLSLSLSSNPTAGRIFLVLESSLSYICEKQVGRNLYIVLDFGRALKQFVMPFLLIQIHVTSLSIRTVYSSSS